MESIAAHDIIGVIAKADAVQKFVALLLLAMSVATWYLILAKSWQIWRIHRRGLRAARAVWEAPQTHAALERMRSGGDPFHDLVETVLRAVEDAGTPPSGSEAARSAYSARLLRLLRRSLRQSRAAIESGLALLASVGATAPFVGLFGTVWGIYHALVGIGFTGQATIDKVAGPVGEALVMTAFGIAVAIPAVLAYNFTVRANRRISAELDAFAHDLHAWAIDGPARPVPEPPSRER